MNKRKFTEETKHEEKFKEKLLTSTAVAALTLVMVNVVASAGTGYIKYDTTVAKLNGSGYTGYQTKSIAGANGLLLSKRVGGNYVVDARMNCSAGNAAWARDISDNKTYSLPGSYKQTAGKSIRVEFSNDWNTPVAVQVEGSWKSN